MVNGNLRWIHFISSFSPYLLLATFAFVVYYPNVLCFYTMYRDLCLVVRTSLEEVACYAVRLIMKHVDMWLTSVRTCSGFPQVFEILESRPWKFSKMDINRHWWLKVLEFIFSASSFEIIKHNWEVFTHSDPSFFWIVVCELLSASSLYKFWVIEFEGKLCLESPWQFIEFDVWEGTLPFLCSSAMVIQHVQPMLLSPPELAQEANPSDHPRASTLFLNKSQTDGEFLCNVRLSPACSSVFID